MSYKNQLRRKFEEFKKKSFPSFPQELEVVADLSLADSNLAGVISSYLAGSVTNLQPEDVSIIKQAVTDYISKDGEEEKQIKNILHYIGLMEELNQLILESSKQ